MASLSYLYMNLWLELNHCLSEKFGGPGQIFMSGALFFPKMLGGGVKCFPDTKIKGQKKFPD
jgi:hypothetical protein